LGKPGFGYTEEEWKTGGDSYSKKSESSHKKPKSEVDDLIEKVLKVQELNAQRLVSQEQRKEQAPEPDGQQSSDEGESDRESTQGGGSTKASVESESLKPSTTSTTGGESNNP
jgi:hypothetical protein